MRKQAHPLARKEAADAGDDITVDELEMAASDWLTDSRIRQHSPRTLETRQLLTGKLIWFLRRGGHQTCGKREIMAFLAYLMTGHEQAGGRWAEEGEKRNSRRYFKPVARGTVATYYAWLRTFFAWMAEDGVIDVSPFSAMKPPVNRPDQVKPFTVDDVKGMLEAAQRGTSPARDEAIMLLLLDTGLRVSELCGLTMADVDLVHRRVVAEGKGGKRRTIPFGRAAGKALAAYLRHEAKKGRVRGTQDHLFAAERSVLAHVRLTRKGVELLIARLAEAAGVEGVRCSPHTFRHTFAIEFLRAGGSIFALKELLGHTALSMVNRYVCLAQADIEAQHRLYSPADRLRKR